jgi:hypothetical protein
MSGMESYRGTGAGMAPMELALSASAQGLRVRLAVSRAGDAPDGDALGRSNVELAVALARFQHCLDEQGSPIPGWEGGAVDAHWPTAPGEH